MEEKRITISENSEAVRTSPPPKTSLARSLIGSLVRSGSPVSEIIGRFTYVKPIWGARVLLNKDKVQSDYIFYDQLRHGKAKGYEIGGLFADPICQILASYVLGNGISATLVNSAALDQLDALGKLKSSVSEQAKVLNFQKPKKATASGNAPSTALPIPGKSLKNNLIPKQITKDSQPVKSFGAAGGIARGEQPLPSTGGTQGSATPAPASKPVDVGIPGSGNSQIDWTNQLLSRFMESHQGFFQRLFLDWYGLGDAYVIVNPDASLSFASPETVTLEFPVGDYKEPERVIIRTKLERAIVQDIYTKDHRSVKIHYFDRTQEDVDLHYENLIGRIPIVHFKCNATINEVYGRPIYEKLVPLFSRFDDLFVKQIDGVELLANPIPTFSELDDIQETIAANTDTTTYTDVQGNEQTRTTLRFDRLPALFLGKGGKFSFSAPGAGFTNDTSKTLEQMFSLIINSSRIPEFLWGMGVDSSKASTETQLPSFVKYVESLRMQAEGIGADEILGRQAVGGMQELLDVWLKTYRQLNPSVIVAPIAIKWPELTAEADLVRFQWTSWAMSVGLLHPETALDISGLVDDPAAEVAKAMLANPTPPDFTNYSRRLDMERLKEAQKVTDVKDEQTNDDTLSSITYDPMVLPSELNNDFTIQGPALWQPIP